MSAQAQPKLRPQSSFVKSRLSLLSCFPTLILMATLAMAQTAAPSASAKQSEPWRWPDIPGCLADPGTTTKGDTRYDAPICPIYERLLASQVSHLELKSARRLNAEMDGVLYPAFLPGTEAVSFMVTSGFNKSFRGNHRLVRVSGSSIGARSGSWWTTLDAVSPGGRLLDGEGIRARLALLATPVCVAYADKVRVGVRGYMGAVAPAFAQPGGGIQFWFPPGAVVATKVEAIPGATGCDAK